MTARNGAATKARPKGPAADTRLPGTSSAQRAAAKLAKDNEKLRADLDVTSWLLAELLFSLRLSAVQQLLATQQGQAAMAQQIMSGQIPGIG